MDEDEIPKYNRNLTFRCPMCDTTCRVSDESYWIDHHSLCSDIPTPICIMDHIMLTMDESNYKYSHLFSHMESFDHNDEQLIWNEFINIYETKLKYILILEKF